MMRTLLAGCCLVGLVLGGALAPAVGIGTPVPDLGAEASPSGGSAFGGDGGGGGDGTGIGNGSRDGLGVASYGGLSAGGYPEGATVGGRLELSDHEALRVESPQPRRWRLGAYATYTGDGWARNGTNPEPLAEPLPTTQGDRSRPQYEVRVTARRPFEGLVSAWRPAFAAADDRSVLVDRERALTVESRIEPGEEYTVFSYGGVSRETAAVASDGEYPAAVESRYTQLPDDTPDRLGARTDEITAGAETPYRAAVAVERWLENNKEYSLNATHDRDADVATEFVFEMEAGYCQYFATTMAAMLRTQGIPARYVTGYGPGEPVDDDEYLVRGENAHTWVEVYVADVGWVTFDPTPAAGRAEAGRDARPINELGDGWRAEADGSGDELDLPTATGDGEQPTTVTLTADPLPGRPASAVVTRNDRPIRNTAVTFNGERVGRTNRAGAVAGRIPYEESLLVEVRLGSQPATAGTQPAADPDSDSIASATGTVEVAFDLPTEIAIEVIGDAEPGTTAGVVATLADDPVENATVAVDGRTVTRTDEQGGATVVLPDADTAEIAVSRGAARGTRTVELVRANGSDAANATRSGDLNVSVSPRFVALPATPADVAVSRQGEPVANATVVVDGEAAGTTGAAGTVEVRLPLAAPVTVTATVPVDDAGEARFTGRGAGIETSTLTGTAVVDGVRRNAGGAVAVVVLLVAGVGNLVRAREAAVRGSTRGARRGAAGALRRAVAGFVGLAGAVDAGVEAADHRRDRAVELLDEGPAGIAAHLRSVGGAVAGSLGRLPGRLLARLRGEAPPAPGGDTTGEPATTVRAAWSEFREHVTVPAWRTSTPGEIARWAVERDGLPANAVATLRRAFREVEYGTGAAADRAAEVREAIDEIRAAADDREAADD